MAEADIVDLCWDADEEDYNDIHMNLCDDSFFLQDTPMLHDDSEHRLMDDIQLTDNIDYGQDVIDQLQWSEDGSIDGDHIIGEIPSRYATSVYAYVED